MAHPLAHRSWLTCQEAAEALAAQPEEVNDYISLLHEARKAQQINTRDSDTKGSGIITPRAIYWEVERTSLLDWCAVHDIPPGKLAARGQRSTRGYTTDLLQVQEEAIKKFWINYDQEEPDTAPSSSDVVDWLKKKGISQRAAEAIDLIIRPDSRKSGGKKVSKG